MNGRGVFESEHSYFFIFKNFYIEVIDKVGKRGYSSI